MEIPAVSQLAEEMVLKTMKCEFKSHLPDQLLENIFKHVKVQKECLIWIGAITKSTGYGKIKWKYKSYDVHRLIGLYLFECIYENKIEICHINECSSRACIRPIHLYKGNRSSNMIDSINKLTHNSLYKERNLVHGTTTGYNYGCKCIECRKANAIRRSNQRVKVKWE